MADSDISEVPDYGIPISAPTTTTDNLGRRRTFAGLHTREWVFLGVSICNILVTMGMTIYSLVRIVQKDSTSPDFTLTLLLLINGAFCLFYVINGLLREKEFEIYMFVGAILFVLMYCILEYVVNVSGRTEIKLPRMIVACVLAPVNIWLGVLVAREFGWLEFRVVGASEHLQQMYREASRYTSLLEFDMQIMITFVLLVLQSGTAMQGLYEKLAVGIGVPISLLWCVFGWLCVRQELHWGMGIFIFWGIVAPSYVCYAIYEASISLRNNTVKSSLRTLVYGTFAAGALALGIRIVVYIAAWRVYRNFGNGLKERAFDVEANERSSLLAVPRRR